MKAPCLAKLHALQHRAHHGGKPCTLLSSASTAANMDFTSSSFVNIPATFATFRNPFLVHLPTMPFGAKALRTQLMKFCGFFDEDAHSFRASWRIVNDWRIQPRISTTMSATSAPAVLPGSSTQNWTRTSRRRAILQTSSWSPETMWGPKASLAALADVTLDSPQSRPYHRHPLRRTTFVATRLPLSAPVLVSLAAAGYLRLPCEVNFFPWEDDTSSRRRGSPSV